MRNAISSLTAAALILIPSLGLAQVSGNIGYGQGGGKARAEQAERAKRIVTKDDAPPTGSATFVDASVLMNVKADEYVAVFGIARDGETLAECDRKMADVVKAFTDALKPLKIVGDDVFVDFVAQSKIYGFEIVGDIAREKVVGFELKKNIFVHYQKRDGLDAVLLAASQSQIHDLIKVDYVVKDIEAVQDKLMEEASAVIKRKAARYEKMLGLKLKSPAQVYAERPSIHYPTSLYDSYVAADVEAILSPEQRNQRTVHSLRKSRTFFFNGLDADGFDKVINPVITEPVVQFTLYLKVKYDSAP